MKLQLVVTHWFLEEEKQMDAIIIFVVVVVFLLDQRRIQKDNKISIRE